MSAKYTIILPCYKGGTYLKQLVSSVLSQSWGDFELAVLENGNVDGSVEWLHSLGDERVLVYPSSTVLPIEANWARALEIPKNEFMTFFGHDDLMDADYLQVMDDLIQREPQASLYFAHFRYIDADGNVTSPCRPLPARETAAEYIATLFGWQRDTYGSGYIMRSADYHAVGGIPMHRNLLFADDRLWISLMHQSWKATAPQECFSVRVHPRSMGVRSRLEWIEGMRSYITFLEELSRRDPAVAQAYRTYAPSYFHTSCYSVFNMVMDKATEENRRLSWRSQREIFAQLTRVSPDKAREMRLVTKRMRIYNLINGTLPTRWLYRHYKSLRGSIRPQRGTG